MGWIKKKYEETKQEFKEDWAEKRQANKEKRKQTRAAYFAERQKQQIELAKKKAVFEREARERQLKAKYAPRPARKFGTGLSSGFGMSAPAKTSMPGLSWQQSEMMSPSYFTPAKPKAVPKIIPKRKKKRSKRKSKSKSPKYIIRGGVAYPVR